MPSYRVPAPDELPKGSRVIFPGGEDYLLKIEDITTTLKVDLNDPNGPKRTFYTVKFSVESFADGSDLEDVNGKTTDEAGQPLKGKWLWKDVDPERMGFTQAGVASIARQFFLAANGISDMNERIPSGETQDLIGRYVVGSLIVKKIKDNSLRNNIVSFKAVGRRRNRAQIIEEPAPAEPRRTKPNPADEAFLAAVQNVTQGEPTPEDLAAVQTFFES